MSCYKRIDKAYLARNHLTQITDWLLHVKCKQGQRLLHLCAVVEFKRTPEKKKNLPKELPHNKGRKGTLKQKFPTQPKWYSQTMLKSSRSAWLLS